MSELTWLPPLVAIDWNDYPASVDRAYAVFARDFLDQATRPSFDGRRLGLKMHPIFEGKSGTFWHLVTECLDPRNPTEADRIPVAARLERIGWIRALIENADNPDRVRRWVVKKKESRWHLALPDFSYLVVLSDRGDFLLPWTAFPVEYESHQMKLAREWSTNRR